MAGRKKAGKKVADIFTPKRRKKIIDEDSPMTEKEMRFIEQGGLGDEPLLEFLRQAWKKTGKVNSKKTYIKRAGGGGAKKKVAKKTADIFTPPGKNLHQTITGRLEDINTPAPTSAAQNRARVEALQKKELAKKKVQEEERRQRAKLVAPEKEAKQRAVFQKKGEEINRKNLDKAGIKGDYDKNNPEHRELWAKFKQKQKEAKEREFQSNLRSKRKIVSHTKATTEPVTPRSQEGMRLPAKGETVKRKKGKTVGKPKQQLKKIKPNVGMSATFPLKIDIGVTAKKHGGKITYKMTGGQVVDAGYD